MDAQMVYDLGCGTGNSTIELLRHFKDAKIVAVDASDGMLEYAKLKFGFLNHREFIRQLFSEQEFQLALFLIGFLDEAIKNNNS